MKNMLQDSRTDLRKNQWIWRQDNLNYSGRSRKKKNEVDKRLRDLWDTIKQEYMYYGNPRKRPEREEQKDLKNNASNIPNLMNLQIQEAQC